MEEKLSILNQMIRLAKADQQIATAELTFLKAVAKQIGVSQQQLEDLVVHPAPEVPLQPESQRILQFHRLVLLMNVDQVITQEEEAFIYQIGLKFGLPTAAITQTLTLMHNYENKMVPPAVLIQIFKAHYN